MFEAAPTTEIYTLSLHDALPIFEHYNRLRSATITASLASGEQKVSMGTAIDRVEDLLKEDLPAGFLHEWTGDRKSTRLNSSHSQISYAVFCLKKKKTSGVHDHTT